MANSSYLENRERRVIESPEQVLKQAIVNSKRLDEESQEALQEGDSETVRKKLRERAEVVADLPEKILDAQAKTGQEFPQGELENLRGLQLIAERALEGGGAFEIGSILSERDSKTGEPNLLEQIANRLYQQQTSSEEK